MRRGRMRYLRRRVGSILVLVVVCLPLQRLNGEHRRLAGLEDGVVVVVAVVVLVDLRIFRKIHWVL